MESTMLHKIMQKYNFSTYYPLNFKYFLFIYDIFFAPLHAKSKNHSVSTCLTGHNTSRLPTRH